MFTQDDEQATSSVSEKPKKKRKSTAASTTSSDSPASSKKSKSTGASSKQETPTSSASGSSSTASKKPKSTATSSKQEVPSSSSSTPTRKSKYNAISVEPISTASDASPFVSFPPPQSPASNSSQNFTHSSPQPSPVLKGVGAGKKSKSEKSAFQSPSAYGYGSQLKPLNLGAATDIEEGELWENAILNDPQSPPGKSSKKSSNGPKSQPKPTSYFDYTPPELEEGARKGLTEELSASVTALEDEYEDDLVLHVDLPTPSIYRNKDLPSSAQADRRMTKFIGFTLLLNLVFGFGMLADEAIAFAVENWPDFFADLFPNLSALEIRLALAALLQGGLVATSGVGVATVAVGACAYGMWTRRREAVAGNSTPSTFQKAHSSTPYQQNGGFEDNLFGISEVTEKRKKGNSNSVSSLHDDLDGDLFNEGTPLNRGRSFSYTSD